jgi:hypothetical protein
MEELKNFSDEELRQELKRRAEIRRKNQRREIRYIEFDAVIKSIDNIQSYSPNGSVKYKPFVFWKYKLDNCSYNFAQVNNYLNEYYMKQGCFKRDTAPKIGDKVKLRYRRIKGPEVFDLKKAKIVEIVN